MEVRKQAARFGGATLNGAKAVVGVCACLRVCVLRGGRVGTRLLRALKRLELQLVLQSGSHCDDLHVPGQATVDCHGILVFLDGCIHDIYLHSYLRLGIQKTACNFVLLGSL